MDRLTRKNEISGEIDRLGFPQQLYKKLWEYEETGLTPKEIEEQKEDIEKIRGIVRE